MDSELQDSNSVGPGRDILLTLLLVLLRYTTTTSTRVYASPKGKRQ